MPGRNTPPTGAHMLTHPIPSPAPSSATAILDYKVVGLPADNPVGDTTTGRVEITATGEVQGSGVVSGQQRLGAGCSCVSRAPACTTNKHSCDMEEQPGRNEFPEAWVEGACPASDDSPAPKLLPTCPAPASLPLQRRFTLPSTYIRSKAYLFTATARNEQGSSQPSDPAFQYTTCAVSACNRLAAALPAQQPEAPDALPSSSPQAPAFGAHERT